MTMQYVIFGILIIAAFMVDLWAHRKGNDPSFKEALAWTCVWVGLALGFNVYVALTQGSHQGMNFLMGYIVELSLSVDNLFVMMVIFAYFKVPKRLQHTVLFWGILGAFVMRGIFIIVGVALVQKFHFMMYIFGLFLVYTGIKTALEKKQDIDPQQNPILRGLRKLVPVTEDYEGDRFFVRRAGRLFITPLMVTVIIMEVTDLIFAVDSIPAILGITTDPFIVATSNFFAILGLRSLYFVLHRFLAYFKYLKYGLGFILSFVGLKMVLVDFIHIPILLSLAIVVGTLMLTMMVSLWERPKFK